MSNIEYTTKEIEEPNYIYKISNSQLLNGKNIPPIDRLKIISPTEYEEIIEEWIHGYLKKQYQKVVEKVVRVGGAGDKGRDIIAYEKFSKERNKVVWENYQCKHYGSALMPSQVWIEFGKLCYYTYIGDYNIPKKYYFVAPLGVGSDLHDYIMEPSKLRGELIKQWDSKCKNKITKREIPLNGKFKDYVEKFDFSIIDYITPGEFIEQYQQTSYFPFRFGGGLNKNPKRPKQIPEKIKDEELLYVRKLFEAYSSHKNDVISNLEELKAHKILLSHFNRQRMYYYQAESVKLFERDSIPQGINAFNELKEQVYHGIIDIVYTEYADGYERIKATTKEAKNLNISGNILGEFINGTDKCGICHHLANEELLDDQITWVIDGL